MVSSDKARPNILLILTDDHGPWAMGCAGNGEILTPNLDRLAATGMRFTDFFCVSPVCSPARASILTGRIPSHHGVHDWITEGNGREGGIDYLEGITAYTDILAAGGYACGISGKWHLGNSATPQKGFSRWYVHEKGGGPYYNAPMYRDGELLHVPEYITDNITDAALGYLEDYARGDGPFYLSVHYTAPHSPWLNNHPREILDLYADCPFDSVPNEPDHPWTRKQSPGPRHTGASREDLLRGYFAAVTAMDGNVGRLLDRLEGLGLREDTLVVFTSDNGMNMGHHGVWGKGNGTFPLNMYDEAVKVPTLMSRPGTVPEGAVCDAMLSHYDLLPTLLECAGLSHPDGESLPGVSFLPILVGGEMPGRDAVVIFDEYGPVRMIRSRAWKYVHRYPYGPHELYDLRSDPGERVNLVDRNDLAGVRNEMRAGLDAWFLRYADFARDGARQPVYGRGQIERVDGRAQGRPAFIEQME